MNRKNTLNIVVLIFCSTVIIFGSIVLEFGCFTINGSVVKTNKEHTELLNAYMMNDAIDQGTVIINRIENIKIAERINERKCFELSDVPKWMQEDFDYETYYADLTEEDSEFLREHVFGQWRFSERIFSNGRGEDHNFSEQGIEDMKNIVVSLDADRVDIVSGLNQETFTNSQDAYIFADYGGFLTTDLPVYYVSAPQYTTFEAINFSFAEKKELVSVRHNLGYWQSNWKDPGALGNNGYPLSYLAEYLYIDPEDTDTLYMSFGGLWELKRDNGNYYSESETSLLSGHRDEKWEYDLTEEDMEFLDKHLFGQWEFSKRLIALDEEENDRKGTISNFSDLGVKELKEIRFTYEEGNVRPLFLRKFFTDVKDMYLFGIYGGLNIVDLPYYHIDTDVDENNICLTDIYGTGVYSVRFPEEKELVRVYYNLGYDETSNPSISGIYMGSNIYIDPDDTDTIYLDFGGLWEMKRDEQNYNTNGKRKAEDNSGGSTGQNQEAIDFESAYKLLNQDLFGKSFEQWFDNALKQEIFLYSEEVKGEFAEVQNEESIFPAELISSLEKMIYQSLDSTLDKFTWEEIQESIYFETIKEFGSEDFELDLGEMQNLFPVVAENAGVEDVYDAYKLVSGEENCEEMFHFHMADNQDNYVLVVDSGGSEGLVSVRLTERINDEFIVISEFETQNAGYGRVIQFGDEFYYIFLEYNYNMKNYDGVRIYKLGNNAGQENLKIKYLPYNYIWKNIYNTSAGLELDTYIESVKEEITSDKYMENGGAAGVSVFYGDEEEADDFTVPEDEYYRIDFGNTGIPVYLRKSNLIPSSYRDIWHLRSTFYMVNPKDNSISKLDKLEIGYDAPATGESPLVQMWFKEMGEKVYTCCLYHVSDYNYVLNICLLEGEQITRIRTDFICPQRRFVLTEGEIDVTLAGNAENQKVEILNQINQSDYTKMVYHNGNYYYQSSADHFYLYKSDQSGENQECVVKQVPKEIYVLGEWIYFTNYSDGQNLYRVRIDGTEQEKILNKEIKRFFPFEDKIIYIAPNDEQKNCLYSWSEQEGTELMFEGGCVWICTDGNYLYLRTDHEDNKMVVFDREKKLVLQEPEWENEPFIESPEQLDIQAKRKVVEEANWEYGEISDFCIVNEKIFFKQMESKEKGELWYWIDVEDGKPEIFEDMQPYESVDVVSDAFIDVSYAGEFSGKNSAGDTDFWDCDYVIEEISNTEDEDTISVSIKLPQLNSSIQAYQKINEKIRIDAENFQNELMEQAKYVKQNEPKGWEQQYIGHLEYIYAYADAKYVSIVYWKFLGRNGIDSDYDWYVTKLYSAETGEEIEIDELFTVGIDEILLRFSFAIRKSPFFKFLNSDADMLERHNSDNPSYRSYYLLTERGIDVFFIEIPRTKATTHFIIAYDEFEDILKNNS